MEIAHLRVVVDGDISGASAKLDTLNTKVNNFSTDLKQGLGMGAGLAIFQQGVSLVGQGLDAAKGAVIGFNQGIDAARAAMGKFFATTEDLNNSLLALQQLGNKTPFQFPELVTAQQRTIAVARSADELRANMDAITVAAANSGRVSGENFDKISLALGQISTKGRVMGEELMQLNEAGVNGAQILADYFKISTGEVLKLAEQGKITSQDMFAAMRAYAADPANRQALDGLAATFEGSMSTIKDVVTSTTASAFRPFFDLLTEGANTVARFLQSDEFQGFAEAVRIGMEGAAAGVRALMDQLAPVGQLIATVVSQITQGDFGGAFNTIGSAIASGLENAGRTIQAFAGQFFGAGVTLISELASGIVQGGQSILTSAIDAVAQLVADFFIGHSPPPKGPLAEIDKGGLAVAAAWVAGFADGMSDMKSVAEGAAGNIASMKAASERVEDVLRGINREMRELDSAADDIRRSMDDIKDSTESQLRPIEDQIRAIKERRDYAEDERDLLRDLEGMELRRARLMAEGDPVKRAQLASQIAELQAQKEELSNEFRLNDLRAKASGDIKSETEERLRRLKDEASMARFKDESDSKRERRAKEIAKLEMEVRRERDEASREQGQRNLNLAELEAKILGLKKEQNSLANKPELARIKAAEDALKLAKDETQQTRDRETLERKISLLPLDQQARAIRDAQREQIEPLQDQLKLVQRQKDALGDVKSEWQAIKEMIGDKVGDLTESKAAADKAAKDGKPAGASVPRGPLVFDLDAATKAAVDSAKARGAEMAEGMAKGFNEWVSQHFISIAFGSFGALFGGSAGGGAAGAALGTLFGPVGTVIGAVIGTAIGSAVGAWLGGSLGGLVEQRLKSLGINWSLITAGFDQMKARFASDGIGGLVADVGQRLGAALPMLGARLQAWGAAFVDWLMVVTPQVLGFLGGLVDQVLGAVAQTIGPLQKGLFEWTVAFVKWVNDALPGLLDELAGMARSVIGWVGETVPKIVGALADWATEFVAWVRPRVPDLLTELGTLVVRVVEWMAEHAKELVEAIGNWAVEFVVWVAPRIGPLLEELGKLLIDVGGWIVTTALPEIVKKLAQWGAAMYLWVAKDALPGLAGALGQLWDGTGEHQGLSGWIVATAKSIGEAAKSLGSWLLFGDGGAENPTGGILGGIKGSLARFWGWLQEEFVDKIPEFVKKLLDIKSPSGVMFDIGVNIVEGLRLGMERRLPSIDAVIKDVVGRVSNAQGSLKDWIQAAVALTGVPANWVKPLVELATLESSGDPGAKNPQAVNGQHATGLMQMMPGTFRGYKMDGFDDILNPVHNAIAAINYIRYGNKPWLGNPWNVLDNWEELGGYAKGGIAWEPQIAKLAEREPEAIIPLSQLVGARSSGPMQTIHMPITIGGRVVEDIWVQGREMAIRRGRVPAGASV